ncbi:hypothetical protein C1H46_013427 [Malus baccata]|uniref:Uncharacterized protein n=1 Tax=Malus baccata TaxID=106549 RepID=A0A540MQ10_MALBA|nr:hypothetical protein C1H46_013427 [Malus baccata]
MEDLTKARHKHAHSKRHTTLILPTGIYPSLRGLLHPVPHTNFNFPSDYPDFNFLEMSDGLYSIMLELALGLQPLRCQRFGLLTATTSENTRFKVIFSRHLEHRDGLEQSSLTWLQKEYQIPLFLIGHLHKTVPSRSTSL